MAKDKNNVDISTLTEEELCVRCEKAAKNEDSDYCEKCEKEMLTRKVPLVGWITGAIAIVLCIFSAVILYYIASPSILGVSAEIASRDNRWEDAYYDYSKMLAEIEEISLEKEGKLFTPDFIKGGYSLKVNYVKAIIKATDPITGLYGVSNIYADIDPFLKDKEVKEYYDIYNSIGTTEYAVYYALQEVSDYDSCIEVIKSVAEEDGVDLPFLSYYAFELARDYRKPFETQIKILETCDKLAKESGRDYTWLYAFEYAKTLRYMGRYDEALKWLDVLIKENKNNFEALSQKMEILYISGKKREAKKLIEDLEALYNNTYIHTMNVAYLRLEGKLDEAAELGDTILGAYESSPELYRQLALVYLLKNDYDAAYTFAYDAYTLAANYAEYYYDDSWNTVETRNTLYICAKSCKVNGATASEYAGEIDVIVETYESITMGENIVALANGEITPEELLTKGNYDLI